MAENVLPTHESILQLIGDAAPDNWSPRLFAENTGTDRRALDSLLDELRGAALVRLTAWQSGRGQGYELTDGGREILADPRLRAGFREAIRQGGSLRPTETGDREVAPVDDTVRARLEALRTGFTPGPAPITALIVLICVAAFGAGAIFASQNGRSTTAYLFGADAITARAMGALSPGKILEGEWWRLIASSFLHFGILHILFNVLTLRAMGRDLERIYGGWRYLTIYLLSGLTGAVLTLVWSPVVDGRPILVTGASACIWGMMGARYATMVLNKDLFPEPLYRVQIRQLNGLVLFNLFISLVLPQISLVSHIAGGLAGAFLTVVLHHQRWSDFPRKFFAIIVLVAWPIFLLTLLGSVMQTDPRWKRVREAIDIVGRAASLKELRESIVPKVAAIERGLEQLDLNWQKSEGGKGPAPTAENFDALEGTIEAARTVVEVPSPDAMVEEIQISARRYLSALKSEVVHLKSLATDVVPPTDAQRAALRAFRREVKTAKVDWDKVRQVR